jgi:hypothetical protein
MNTDNQIYSYEIPNSLFLPHKVVRKFYARVIYNVQGTTVNIVDVGVSINCLKYINNAEKLAKGIEEKLNNLVKKEISLNNLNTTIAKAIAPYI